MRTKPRSHLRYAAPVAPAHHPRHRPARGTAQALVRFEATRPDGRVVGGLVASALVSLAIWAAIVEGLAHLV